ncbi:hypothetical protein, partial [Streptomyces murinus]|uniref:hypothetical protein n=1 Tax=Streptomyces murinus TaxID=33900 RepID=UPI00117C80DF
MPVEADVLEERDESLGRVPVAAEFGGEGGKHVTREVSFASPLVGLGGRRAEDGGGGQGRGQ